MEIPVFIFGIPLLLFAMEAGAAIRSPGLTRRPWLPAGPPWRRYPNPRVGSRIVGASVECGNKARSRVLGSPLSEKSFEYVITDMYFRQLKCQEKWQSHRERGLAMLTQLNIGIREYDRQPSASAAIDSDHGRTPPSKCSRHMAGDWHARRRQHAGPSERGDLSRGYWRENRQFPRASLLTLSFLVTIIEKPSWALIIEQGGQNDS